MRFGPRKMDIFSLAYKVCAVHKVSVGEIRSGSRRHEILEARLVVSCLAVKELVYSGAEVTRYLGMTTSCITRAISNGKALIKIMIFEYYAISARTFPKLWRVTGKISMQGSVPYVFTPGKSKLLSPLDSGRTFCLVLISLQSRSDRDFQPDIHRDGGILQMAEEGGGNPHTDKSAWIDITIPLRNAMVHWREDPR